MSAVASEMVRMIVESVTLRPYLSPMYPNRIPPSGRTTKLMPKTKKVSIIATAGSSSTKNNTEKTPAKYP